MENKEISYTGKKKKKSNTGHEILTTKLPFWCAYIYFKINI